MKTSTLFAAYREAVARRDITGSDMALFREAVNVEWRYQRIVRQCDRLEKVIARRIKAMEGTN